MEEEKKKNYGSTSIKLLIAFLIVGTIFFAFPSVLVICLIFPFLFVLLLAPVALFVLTITSGILALTNKESTPKDWAEGILAILISLLFIAIFVVLYSTQVLVIRFM